jgi:hypothetical protein
VSGLTALSFFRSHLHALPTALLVGAVAFGAGGVFRDAGLHPLASLGCQAGLILLFLIPAALWGGPKMLGSDGMWFVGRILGTGSGRRMAWSR